MKDCPKSDKPLVKNGVNKFIMCIVTVCIVMCYAPDLCFFFNCIIKIICLCCRFEPLFGENTSILEALLKQKLHK